MEIIKILLSKDEILIARVKFGPLRTIFKALIKSVTIKKDGFKLKVHIHKDLLR